MIDPTNHYPKIAVQDINGFNNISIINNFIISDGYKHLPNILSGYPFVVDGMAFLIVLKGSGKIKINHKEYTFEKNKIMTALPGFIVEIAEQSDDLLIEHLFFSSDFFTDLNVFRNGKLPDRVEENPCIKISAERVQTLLDFHAFIVKQCKKENEYRKEIARNLLNAMLLEVSSIYADSNITELCTNTRYEELFNMFIKHLYRSVKTERTIGFYADKLFVSPKYLAQIVKRVSGKLASEWIADYTILLIKAMLKSSTMSVAQISEELNFPNPSFFGRYFKKQTGLTPIEYRNQKN